MTLAALTLTTPRPAAAHLELLEPPPRHANALKTGPCGSGEDVRGREYTRFEPGQTITIRWDEYIDHPGWYRVSFDPDGADDFVDPASPDDFDNNPSILLDNIVDREGGGEYEVEVTLPDLTCERCTLQVIQVMLDKPPYGDGDDLYYQCADLVLGDGENIPDEDDAGGCACASASGSRSPAATAMLLALLLLPPLARRRRECRSRRTRGMTLPSFTWARSSTAEDARAP